MFDGGGRGGRGKRLVDPEGLGRRHPMRWDAWYWDAADGRWHYRVPSFRSLQFA
jgi:hypothetical protein